MNQYRVCHTRCAAHRRGGAYLVVLSTTMLVTVLGLSSILLMRVRQRVSDTTTNVVVAGIGAPNTLDLAMFRITNDPNWRTTYLNNQWTADENTLNYKCSFRLVDEVDGDLTNDPSQPVRLYGRASAGGAVRIYSVRLEATKPPNLLLNGDAENGLTHWTGIGPEGTCNLVSDTSTSHTRSACILATNRTPNSDTGPHQDITSVIKQGQPYYAEVWFKDTLSSGRKHIVLVLDTTNGLQLASFDQYWTGTSWTKMSGTVTPTWTGTLNAAYFRIGTGSGTSDYRIDGASLIEGTGPASYKMVPVPGTWRRETAS